MAASIVYDKATAPVEFGAKLDLNGDREGYGRIERIAFGPYNEESTLQEAVDCFRGMYRALSREDAGGLDIQDMR